MNTHILRAQSPAKINLFLHITGQRPDGYHLLESLFCPINLYDDITLTLRTIHSHNVMIERTGDLLHVPAKHDLTFRACNAFFKHHTPSTGWHINIDVKKRIPEQAGLGGGSSNAATVLQLLQTHFQHPIEHQALQQIAQQLGADVPFFLLKQSAFVEGIGEQLSPCTVPSEHLLVFKPQISCPTIEIFSDRGLTKNAGSIKILFFDSVKQLEEDASKVGSQKFFSWVQEKTDNVLQDVVKRQKKDWKSQFAYFERAVSEYSPLLVRMTGSGSAMFAVFASPSQLSMATKAVANAPEMQAGTWFEAKILPNTIE